MTGLLAGMDATMKAVEYKTAVCAEWNCATTVLVAILMTLPGLLVRTAAQRYVEGVITDVCVVTHRHFMTITVVGVKETCFSEKKTKSINFIFDVTFVPGEMNTF